MIDRLEQAEMLDAVAREIGHVVWGLQNLEWMLGRYAVMVRQDVRGVGMTAAAPVLARVEKKTFGVLLRELVGAKHIEGALATRLAAIVDERNWIVHRSRNDNRGITNSRERCAALLHRLERANSECADLQHEVLRLMTRVTANAGVTQESLDRETERFLTEWGFLG